MICHSSPPLVAFLLFTNQFPIEEKLEKLTHKEIVKGTSVVPFVNEKSLLSGISTYLVTLSFPKLIALPTFPVS